MVVVPAGPFVMGATPAQQAGVLAFGWSAAWAPRIRCLVASAGPARTVHLEAFSIDRVEVTNRAFDAFLRATGHPPPGLRFPHPEQPVAGVSWYDAEAYCAWAGKRLPREAEWEKAARGRDGRAYPWGDAWDASWLRSADAVAGRGLADFAAWNDWRAGPDGVLAGAGRARPDRVGEHVSGASPYGVLDMAGNLWEWTADWYGADTYARGRDRDPRGPAMGRRRVLRGGAWDVPRVAAVAWFREDFMAPEEGRPVTGFRCAADGSKTVARAAVR